jgi:hypothetical protein
MPYHATLGLQRLVAPAVCCEVRHYETSSCLPAAPVGEGCFVEQHVHAVAVEQQHTMRRAICTAAQAQVFNARGRDTC